MAGYIGPAPVPQATQTRETFTATSGQTTFNTGGYTAGYIDVFLNGVKLAAADYTATNGSDVVLATGAATGDILETVAYTAFTVADQDFTGTTTTEDLTVTGAFTSQGIDDNATSTAMTLDSSGNLLVGSTELLPADNSIEGMTYRNGLSLQVFRDAGAPVVFGRGSSDGDVAVFSKDGTTVGSISTVASNIAIGKGDTALYISAATDSLTPTTIASGVPVERDGGIDLGRSSARFKDLYLSGGVFLGGTGASNQLTDYETGTWTPTIASAGTITLNSNATYTKIGRTVTLHINSLTFNDITSTSALGLNGLPFAPSGSSAVGHIMSSYRDDDVSIVCFIPSTTSQIRFYKNSTTAGFNRVQHNIFNNSSNALYLTITYQTS